MAAHSSSSLNITSLPTAKRICATSHAATYRWMVYLTGSVRHRATFCYLATPATHASAPVWFNTLPAPHCYLLLASRGFATGDTFNITRHTRIAERSIAGAPPPL